MFASHIQDSRYLKRGSSDGFFGGYKYFKCDKDCAVFVSLDKIAAKLPHQVPHCAIPQQPRGFALPRASSVDKPLPPHFKINDRVVVYNKKNKPLRGSVRWTGKKVQTRNLDTNHIGIETVSDMFSITRINTTVFTQDWLASTNDFPNALTGITHLFKVTPGHRLVLPEDLVFREELAITRTPPARDGDVDLSDPAAAAREEGVSRRRLMAEQRIILEKAEQVKKKAKESESAELIVAKDLWNESIDISKQKELLDAFSKGKKEEAVKKSQQEEARTKVRQPSGGPSIQKQNSWHPGSDRIYDPMPGDRNSPHPLPRQNERIPANDHERVHQQQGGPGGGYPPPTYSQPPQDQKHHRGTGQTHDSRYPPQHDNTRPESVQQPQPQRDMRRVNSHNQMTPQNTGDLNYVKTGGPDYDNWAVVDHRRSQRNDQSNQPPQGNQWQGNPQQPGAQQYHNVQYQQPPSGQEFGGNPNTIYPPPNNEAYGHPPDHDTPGGHHQTTPPQVSQEFNASVGSSNPYNLGVGSNIQVASVNPNDPQHYGVIRWTGRVAGVDGQVAGIELVSIIIHVYELF